MVCEHFPADQRREPLRCLQNVGLLRQNDALGAFSSRSATGTAQILPERRFLRENGDLRALSSRFAMGTAQTLPERRFSKGKR